MFVLENDSLPLLLVLKKILPPSSSMEVPVEASSEGSFAVMPHSASFLALGALVPSAISWHAQRYGSMWVIQAKERSGPSPEMGWEAEIVKHAWTGLRGVWVPKGTEVN